MRQIININKSWKFSKGELCNNSNKKNKLINVNIPHTWNNLDGQDGGNDYYRGTCYYLKKLGKIKKEENQVIYLEFNGVNAESYIYFNDHELFHHQGGFSTFRIRIDEYLNDENIIKVKVSNEANDYIYPQFADFTFFGGIYRDVNLIKTNTTHFDLDYFGGPGVTITPTINDKNATIDIECYVSNYDNQDITYEIYTKDNQLVASKTLKDKKCQLIIKNPHLWNGVIDPYLYTAKIKIQKDGIILDNKEVRFGVRTFSIDPELGFFLNNKSYPLHGVSRHQDRLNKGWAISKKDHLEDITLIKELGANTIRLAHYQHDQYFYDLCDEVGMVVWAEIPFISNPIPNGFDNAISQMKELVIQNYNHPSIAVWGLSNEITIGGESDTLIEQHKTLNKLVKELDPTRLTTMAQVSMLKTTSEMNHISDVISYNHYFGWYGGETKDNGIWLDNFHKENPNRCLGVSEYGCEAILKWHTSNPDMGDYTEEYQSYYHHQLLETFRTRPYLWATHVWNMFDFGVDMRDEGGVKGRNNKGLVTYDRKTKKDSYYLYQAYWTTTPMIHIASKRYVNRCEDVTKVYVYSNQDEVSLYVNNKLFETKKCDKVVLFEVPLNKNLKIVAKANGISDKSFIKKVDKPDNSYILEKSNTGVTNWFDKDGNEVKLTFNEGYFSIKDKIKVIQEDEQAGKVFQAFMDKFVEIAKSQGMELPTGILKMMGSFTIERISKMAGDRIPKDAIVQINEQLQKCKKNK